MKLEKKLSFAIIGEHTPNTDDLCNAAKEAGHEVAVLKMADVRFEIVDDSFCAKCGALNIMDFDIVIFRAYNEHIYEAQLLARMIREKGKTVIERSLAGEYVRGKLQQAEKFAKHSVPHPQIWQASSASGWQELLENIDFPILAKPVFGRKGRGITKLDSLENARNFFTNNYSDYLAQRYMQIKGDYRIFIVGGKAVGGFRRFILDGEYVSNKRGTPGEAIEVSKEMADIAIAAAQAINCEIAGVDLLEHDGKLYVIEANIAPQWEKFKLITGINPAPEIIKYATERHLQKK